MIVIERRFRGPPESGHGGYTCGLLAREIPGAAEVSLRVPSPLERRLTLAAMTAGSCTSRATRSSRTHGPRRLTWSRSRPSSSAPHKRQSRDTLGSPATRSRCASDALTGRIDGPLRAGKQHIVTAWHIGRDGRKCDAACAISTPEGEMLGRSRALWIELNDPAVFGAGAGL